MPMPYLKEQQTALVTGASSGIGEATAIALQKTGYKVYAAARRTDRMKHLQKQGIITVRLDVSDDTSMKRVVKKIEKESGTIDVLINNAGYGSYGALEDVPMEEARMQVEVNLFGLARLSQLVIPKMRIRRRGTIINISSIGGKMGEPFGTWYHTTKYAVEGLSDSLALELKPFDIHVVIVEPGIIRTAWYEISAANMLKASDKGPYSQSARKKAASFRRAGESFLASPPEKIAEGIVKILSKKRPKLRYPIGGGARSFMLLRKLTSDRLFYGIIGKFL